MYANGGANDFLTGEPTSQLLRYVYSSDIDAKFKIKVGTLEGDRPKPPCKEVIEDPLLRNIIKDNILSDLVVTVEIFSDAKSLALPTQTSYKPFTTRYNWNEWLTLPLKFSDLPRDAQLCFTVWDLHGPKKAVPVGGTTVSVFTKSGAMRQGMHDLKLWPNTKADGSITTSTPGKLSSTNDQMSRLIKLTKKHRNGEMARVDWMDRLTFRQIEIMNNNEKKKSMQIYLMVEFPRVVYKDVEHTVVYFEKELDQPCYSSSANHSSRYTAIFDPDVWLDNLVEDKHHKLSRNQRTEMIDKDLKPNASIRDQLNRIVNKCSTNTLSTEEQDLIWKFRFYLKNQKKALAKFVRCVNWSVQVETFQALELMKQWEPMDVEDALELLGPQFSHMAVRRYAVNRLEQASDEDLLLYLLQLVQALKYEPVEAISASTLINPSPVSSNNSASAFNQNVNNTNPMSITRSVSQELESSIQSTGASSTGAPNDGVHDSNNDLTQSLRHPTEDSCSLEGQLPMAASVGGDDGNRDLASFLIKRASRSDVLANYFFWYLHVESENSSSNSSNAASKKGTEANPYVACHSQMYRKVMERLNNTLLKGNREFNLRRNMLKKQSEFLGNLVTLMKAVAAENTNRQRKIEKLKQLLKESEAGMFGQESLALPLNPKIRVKSIVSEKATLFKSALMPCRLTFLTEDDKEYVAIFKHGDDLRQDQLILQIITLMDKLLRRENLDLKLTPYSVLASSTKHGFVEYIEARTVADILKEEGSIQSYFRKCAPQESAVYNIVPDVMDNYVKSCAGYCVITYLLGVGDRHLDNLLLTKDGKLFHIDFGYILGRDPKPLPPPMKLSKEMVEAMGGVNADHYNEFKKQCYTTFLNLRRHANLILNLFSLMVDASVPDIALEPDKTVKKVQDKFMLEMTDEEAVSEMQRLIDSSVTAVMAVVVESLHKWAQYWRK